MATVIKKISELERLEELTSSSNVIIEENGKAKRFSAANLGKVKTVNGVEPDENGNIEVEVGFGGGGVSAQPDWNQNDESAADYVKNRTHYITITDKELLPETLFSNDDEGCAVVDYVDFEGINTATVTYDGKEYVCEVKKETNPNSYMYYLGNRTLGWGGEGAPDTGEPFYVEQWCELFEGEWDRSTIVCAADDSSHTVKIVCAVEDVKKIDENYIPDTIARVADIEAMLGNLNSASDKATYVEWNVNREYEFAPSPAGDALVKLSETVPGVDSIIGATFVVTLAVDGQTMTESAVITSDMVVETDYGYVYGYNEDAGLYFVTAESATIADTVLTRGVWCQNLAKMSGYVEFKIFKEFVTPKVTTAQVGQTIVVKSVDANGKPTEWEAVDIPDANAPKNEFILNSSTEGSAKKFKITVDDNGKLTATEIVESEA